MSGQFEAVIRSLEEERDRYRQECELLKSTRSRPTSPSRLNAAREKVHFCCDVWNMTAS